MDRNLSKAALVSNITRLHYFRLIFLAAFFALPLRLVLAEDPIYDPGGDVKPPKLIHYVEPESSPSSDAAYTEGVVKLSAVVNTDGLPSDAHVTKGLNKEEDRLALEALKQWRFKPGTKSDQPVRVRINVEIAFHLL